VQNQLRSFAKIELINSVGEVMDTKDIEIKSKDNIFATVIKYAMTLLLLA
jgi:hypothetical protein